MRQSSIKLFFPKICFWDWNVQKTVLISDIIYLYLRTHKTSIIFDRFAYGMFERLKIFLDYSKKVLVRVENGLGSGIGIWVKHSIDHPLVNLYSLHQILLDQKMRGIHYIWISICDLTMITVQEQLTIYLVLAIIFKDQERVDFLVSISISICFQVILNPPSFTMDSHL